MTAIINNNASLVENILKEKIEIDNRLFKVLDNKLLEIVASIIKYCDSNLLNKQNEKCQTALTFADENGFERIVELILNHGGFDKKKSLFNRAFFISKDKITDIFLHLNLILT